MIPIGLINEQDLAAIPCLEAVGPSFDTKIDISVLMITWSHASYISQAIESIISQKCDFSFELIIGEDCSNDTTREICIDFQNRYPEIIRLVTSDENVGMHRNLARIWRCARGRYIAMCEGDDYYIDDEKLSKQVAFMESHPNYAMCGAITERVCKGDRNNWISDGHIQPSVIKESYSVEDLIPEYSFHTSSVIIRKAAIQFPRWLWDMYCADRPLYLLAAEQGNVGFIPEVMSAYRIHSGGIWSPTSQVDKAVNGIKLFETLDNYFSYHYHALIRKTLAGIIWSYMTESFEKGDSRSAKSLYWKSVRYSLPWPGFYRVRVIVVMWLRLYMSSFYYAVKR